MEIKILKKSLKKAVSFLLVCVMLVGISGEGLLFAADAIGEAVYSFGAYRVTDGNVTDGNVTDGNVTGGNITDGDTDFIIESIVIDPVTAYEYTHGHYTQDGSYDGDKDEWIYTDEYFYYNINPERLTVTFADGTSMVYNQIYHFAEDWCESYDEEYIYQSYYNPLGVGTYTVDYWFDGRRVPFTFEIVKSDVAKIEVPTVYICEGKNGYTEKDTYTDEATGNEVSCEYHYYSLDEKNFDINVTFKDGRTEKYTYNELRSEFSCEPVIITDQSYLSPWTGGKHKAVIKVLGVQTEFDVEFCSHGNTEEYPALTATCKDRGFTEGTYCYECKTWIEGREETNPVDHKDDDLNGLCDFCGKTMDFIRYFEAMDQFTYRTDYEFDENNTVDDYFVRNYLMHMGYFDEYGVYGEYGIEKYVNVPYDVFMQRADENFAVHSDMIDYFTDNDMFTDESKEYLTWYYGGLGGVRSLNLTSVYKNGDGTVVLRGFISDLLFDCEDVTEGNRYIRMDYDYINEFGGRDTGSNICDIDGAYELVVRENEKALQLISFREIKSYIHNRTLHFIKKHNLRDIYYQLDIENGEGAEIVTEKGTLTDELVTFDKYNYYWFSPGSEFIFDVETEEGYNLEKVILCDKKGETALEKNSDGAYCIKPEGPAVLKIVTEKTDTHEHSYEERVVVPPTCTEDGVKEFICGCTDSYTEVIPSVGHAFGEWIIQGNKSYCECENCGYRKTITITGDGEIEIESTAQPDCDFEAEDVTKTDDRYVLVENVLANGYDTYFEILKVFDITLKNKDGVHVQPSGTVKVKLPLDWEKDGQYKVYRVNDDGTLTDMDAFRQGSHMVFESDHFSLYVIVDESVKESDDIGGSTSPVDFIRDIINWLTEIFAFLTAFIRMFF